LVCAEISLLEISLRIENLQKMLLLICQLLFASKK